MTEEQPNPDKLDRETGLALLKAYMFTLADDQRRSFVSSQDYVPANQWGLFAFNVRAATTFEAVLATVIEFAEEDPGDAAYLVLEALCSYRRAENKHVERKVPPITPPTHSHGHVEEKMFRVVLNIDFGWHVNDFEGKGFPDDDQLKLDTMESVKDEIRIEGGYEIAYVELVRETIVYS